MDYPNRPKKIPPLTDLFIIFAFVVILGYLAYSFLKNNPTSVNNNYSPFGEILQSSSSSNVFSKIENTISSYLNIGSTNQVSVVEKDNPDASLSLSFVQTVTFLPKIDIGKGVTYSRPELQNIEGKFYLAYSKKNSNTYFSSTLDSNLNEESTITLASLGKKDAFPTDLRSAQDSQGNYWYAIEYADRVSPEVIAQSCKETDFCSYNNDSLALYQKWNLVSSAKNIVNGCVVSPVVISKAGEACFIGKTATDDPTPFFYDDKYYLANRQALGSIIEIRSFDRSFAQLSKHSVDFGKFSNNQSISQNTFVLINDKPYLIGGVLYGKNPNDLGAYSEIMAFEFDKDLKNVLSVKKLVSNQGEMDTRVTSARYDGKYLYFTYLNNKSDQQITYLEAFDVANNFKSLGRIVVSDKKYDEDAHNSLEIFSGKIYIAYIGEGLLLKIAEYELKSGVVKNNIDTTKSDTQSNTSVPLQKSSSVGKCGDGICDAIEKSSGMCSADCK